MVVPAFGAASQAAADDVAVIVNKSNPVTSMTIVQLRTILLGEGATWTSGVGFIKASQVDDSVKVVTIDGSRPGQPAYKRKFK